jgi:predicted esterase
MRDMKKYEIHNLQTIARYIFIVVIISISAFACSSEDTEVAPEVINTEINWRATHTIKELISQHGAAAIISDTVIFKAVIISNDANKNVSNQIFLQDSESGISLGVNLEGVSGKYVKGTEVFVLATSMKYTAATNELSFVDNSSTPADQLEKHINILSRDQSVSFEIVTNLSTIKPEFTSKLIKVYTVQFDEALAGRSIVADNKDTDRIITDRAGNTITVRVKSSASFAGLSMPFESGNLEGILIYEAGKPIIIPNSADDFAFTGRRHSLFTKATFQKDGESIPYQIMYPRGYDKSKSYPLVVFLHGAGERGTDNERQMASGPQTFSTQNARENYPAIVIFPQCPSSDMWSRRTIDTDGGGRLFDFPVEATPNSPMNLVIELTKDLIANEAVNNKKVYVMGLSMGGIGTLEFLYYASDIPAAAISIAGGHNADYANVYATKVAVRLYAGTRDTVVPPIYSQQLIAALDQIAGSDAEYFEADRGHEWNYILDQDELVLSWLWSKSK